MKKTLLSVALLIAAVTGMTVNAQTPPASSNDNTTPVCNKPCDKKTAKRYNPFEGINLTDKQKAELQALKSEKQSESQKTNGKCKKQGKDKKCTCKPQNKNSRREYLTKVKSILSPEQYVQYLENSYVAKPFNRGNRMAKKHNGSHKISASKEKRIGKINGRGQKSNANNQPATNESSYYIDNGTVKVFPYQSSQN